VQGDILEMVENLLVVSDELYFEYDRISQEF